MSSAQHKHILEYSFDYSSLVDGFTESRYVLARNKKSVDSELTLKGDSIVFEYERSEKHDVVHAVDNALREKMLVRVLYYYAASFGFVPRISNVSLSVDGVQMGPCPSAEARLLGDRWAEWSTVRFDSPAFLTQQQAALMLGLFDSPDGKGRFVELLDDEGGDAVSIRRKRLDYSAMLRTAMSYLLASMQTPMAEEGRMRHLWSAFNSIYSSIEVAPDYIGPASGHSEISELYRLSMRVLNNGVPLTRSKAAFEKLLTESDSLSKLRWHRMKQSSICNQVKRKEKDVPTINNLDGLIDRTLFDLIRVTVSNEEIEFEPGVMKKLEKYSETGPVVPDKKAIQILFLITHYVYQLRCDSMHGNKEYPLFLVGTEDSLGLVNDVLQAFVEDLLSDLTSEMKLLIPVPETINS